jgi:PAS domain S-box-containing protein
MIRRIRQLLAPPVFPQDNKATSHAYTLNRALLAFIAGSIIALIGSLFGGNIPHLYILLNALWVVANLILCWQLKRGRLLLAGLWFLGLNLVFVTAGIVVLGTVRAPVTATYMVLIMAAGLIFEIRGLLITSILSSLLTGALIVAENQALLPRPDYTLTITQWITYNVLFAWTGFVVFSAIKNLYLALSNTKLEIAERIKTEQQLHTMIERLNLATRAAHMGIWDWDVRKNELAWDDQMYALYGANKEDFSGAYEAWLNGLHPDDRAASDEMSREALQGTRDYDTEFRVVLPDGTIRTLKAIADITRGSDGKPLRMIGVNYDITDQKRAEESLRASEQRFHQLADASFEGVAITDSGRLLDVNKSLLEMLGYEKAEELLGKSAIELTPLEYREIVKVHMTAGYEEPYESMLTRKDGTTFSVEVHGKMMDMAGRRVRVTAIKDISERKRMKEEKKFMEERLQRSEKMESLGTLAGGVAHDLNNVLGIIVGYSELILDSVDESNPIKSHLVNIMNGGQKAAAIVDDLLTLARRGVQGRSIINLNKIVAECQNSPELANLSIHHPSIKVITDLETDLLNISGSPTHLGKSLYNMVSNACEAMIKGGTVTIRTTNAYLDKPIQGYDHIRQGDYVVLSISDTGDGINEADLKRIFEPFYTKKVMGRSGTGLGLAVVWGTVKDHNGYINLQSEEGKGSTFTLYLPVTREEITAEAAAAPTSEYLGRGENILVVDDVSEQRDLATSILSTLNYSVTSVSSGVEAVTYLKDHEVDLMVLDMIMDPGLDGLDTYKKILEIHPNQKAIIVSGFSESDRVKTAKDLGVGAYVRKPYIKEKLGLAVRKELDRK